MMVRQNLINKSSVGRGHAVAELKTADGLRQARRQQGLSQVELADLLRISQSNISRWENGYEAIPHRVVLRLVEILSAVRGQVHPFLQRMAKKDCRVSIFRIEKAGSAVDFRWLHLGGNLARYFNIPEKDAYLSLSSRFFETEWMAQIYGIAPNDQLVSVEFERDCIRTVDGKEARSCRLRSQEFVIDSDEYSKVTLSISTILGPANGEAPYILNKSTLSELQQLPRIRSSDPLDDTKLSRSLTVPLLNPEACTISTP